MRGVGYDSAYRGPRTRLGGRVRFFDRYVEASDISAHFDVVVCRHVVEHIGAIGAFLTELAAIAETCGAAVTVIETPNFEWTAENGMLLGRVLRALQLLHAAFSRLSLSPGRFFDRASAPRVRRAVSGARAARGGPPEAGCSPSERPIELAAFQPRLGSRSLVAQAPARASRRAQWLGDLGRRSQGCRSGESLAPDPSALRRG